MEKLDYCKNVTCKEFDDEILNNLLGNLRKFDLRTIETKPNMAKARKRLVFGAIETRKQLELGKVKGLIIARNLSDEMILDDDFKFCNSMEIPKIYSLTRKQLGTVLLNQSSRIGIVGILKLDGVHEIWNEILVKLKFYQESWIQKYENDSKFIWPCAFYGHFDLLKRILERYKEGNYVNRCGCLKSGKTPFIVAVERDHKEIVELLMSKGADQDIPDFTLNRPIHLVKSEEVANLLEYNDKENASGLTAIESAIINQRIDVIKVFIYKTKLDIERLLFAATVSNSDKSISYLLRRRRNTFDSDDADYIINSKGNDLLMQSVQNGAYEVFKYLKAQKFEINYERRNNENENIMQISRRVGNIGISRYLEKKFRLLS